MNIIQQVLNLFPFKAEWLLLYHLLVKPLDKYSNYTT